MVVVRISEVYGPGDRRLLNCSGRSSAAVSSIWPGTNLHHPIYVEDLARGLLLAAERPAAVGEVLVLPGRQPVTTNEMVAAVAAAVGQSSPGCGCPRAVLGRRRGPGDKAAAVGDPAAAAPTTNGLFPEELHPARYPRDRAAGVRAAHQLSRRRPGDCRMVPGAEPFMSANPSPAETMSALDDSLTAKIEPFDSFWEAPTDIAKGYRTFGTFYRYNYLPHFPRDRQARILVISCGPGYLVSLLVKRVTPTSWGSTRFPRRWSMPANAA